MTPHSDADLHRMCDRDIVRLGQAVDHKDAAIQSAIDELRRAGGSDNLIDMRRCIAIAVGILEQA